MENKTSFILIFLLAVIICQPAYARGRRSGRRPAVPAPAAPPAAAPGNTAQAPLPSALLTAAVISGALIWQLRRKKESKTKD